ncbi:hypothetical protein [Campylobacter sp.]|uniref:hypothetical protein n=1 Tax=Campylobacter sp. TaxID=205 RepID=UPI003FA02A53
MHIALKIGDIFTVKPKRNELYFVAQILNNGGMLNAQSLATLASFASLMAKSLSKFGKQMSSFDKFAIIIPF